MLLMKLIRVMPPNNKKEKYKIFDSWNELDEQEEQQQTLEIIESMKGISI